MVDRTLELENNEPAEMDKEELLCDRREKLQYPKLFLLFIFGSLFGVLLEGLWCLTRYDHWETHVITILEPLCIIYGFGMVFCYIGYVLMQGKNLVFQFLVYSLIGTFVEVICGFIMEYGLHMKAWDYSGSFMNFKGYVCLSMSVAWGLLGIAFSLLVPAIDAVYARVEGEFVRIGSVVLSVFLTFDFLLTGLCLIRWSERHEGIAASNSVERFIDEKFYDEKMQNRYCEWYFIDA